MTVRKSDLMILETYLKDTFWKMRPSLRYMKERNVEGVMFEWGSNSIKLDLDDITPLLAVMEPDNGYSQDGKLFLRDVLFPFIERHAG